MSCQGDNVCHINALLRHQFPSFLYTDKTYYNVLNASRFKKKPIPSFTIDNSSLHVY